MKRRSFLKRGALFVPALFIPRLIHAQTILTADGLAALAPPPASGGSGPCPPSYGNTNGTGDRTGSITITSSRSFFNNPPEFVDGVTTLSNNFWTADPNVDEYFQFDFGGPVFITEMKWYQSKTTTHGVWKTQGYDGSSATGIGGNFTLGGAGTQTITAASGNTAAYRYYRLVKVSGTVDFTTFIWEIEFKICTP